MKNKITKFRNVNIIFREGNVMNKIENSIFQRACEEAIYNLYLYEISALLPVNNATLGEIADSVQGNINGSVLAIKNAIRSNIILKNSVLKHYIHISGGLTSCVFLRPDGEASVVFKGTGNSEWTDNGEGLSGIATENAYNVYPLSGKPFGKIIRKNDFSTGRQVEALNRFNEIIYRDPTLLNYRICVSGHSKGGNKAQYITMNSPVPHRCFSFNGQGFSPEAVDMFKNHLNGNFNTFRQKIISLCSENDYVNVLGERLMLLENTYYFKSSGGIHSMISLLDSKGRLREQCTQGEIPQYIASVSREVMDIPPQLRRYVTGGIMNIFKKHLAEAHAHTDEKDIRGIVAEIRRFLKNIRVSRNTHLHL